MVGVKAKSGQRPKYYDMYHVLVREHQRDYYERNREAILYGMKHKISVKEARKLLEQQKKGSKKK